ncbi:phospholipase D-like domain-containing protein [Chitinolyticbacter meiyuanensis]|uniref:phospholipase D-like domain-containing protein n=1 Tax=Chitinolyticbacter meiyuanensis TaxID=682798 RepID=UPI001651C9A7|nr:phospholipase D family protein [Chitinolyticbacter meiyuanensis]
MCDAAWFAVAWAKSNPANPTLLKNRRRIKHLVVGIDFAYTDPQFLEEWQDSDVARVYFTENFTFHPKIYLFRKGDIGIALVGSSNFTQGGLAKNEEANVKLLGGWHSEIFQSLKARCEGWWESGQRITAELLADYKVDWEIRQQLLHALKPQFPPGATELLSLSWEDFVENIANDSLYAARLDLLKSAESMFCRDEPNFKYLLPAEHRAIAGVPRASDKSDIDWKLFGSMTGFGTFYNIINSKPASIAKALKCIPLAGPIHHGHYEKFCEKFQRAFEGKKRVGGVPSASRLLAMKRPDYFVCVNRENSRGLAADLGYAASSLTLANYWERVVQPILGSRWWNSTRPSHRISRRREPELWDSRVAMLDGLYYRPPQ